MRDVLDVSLILIFFVFAALVIIFIFFLKSTLSWGKQQPAAVSKYRPIAVQLTEQLSDLKIPPKTIAQASERITKIVDVEVHKQTDKIKDEYSKIIEDKDKKVKQVEKEYETIREEYQVLGKQKVQTEGVVRSMAKGVIILNDEGEVVFLNPVAEKILGTHAKNLIGKAINEVEGNHVISLVNEEGTEERRLANKNADIKDIIKESTAVIQGASGQTRGVVSILTDVTQQKKVDEYKNEFLANVTHDMRTPLICISKSLAAINETIHNLSDEQKSYLDIAVRNAQRLANLVDDILDVSKLEAGRMALRYEVITAQSLIQEVISTLSVWSRTKNIEITQDTETEPVIFEADPDRLHQVLMNLAANALKFTPRGGKVRIDAKVISEKSKTNTEEKEFVQIGVANGGPPMSDWDKKAIFEKFSSASTTATEGEKGTGLGLSIAKNIVELHKGRIWVDTSSKNETYFAFAIPKKSGVHFPTA